MEVNLDALRIAWQNKLSAVDYHHLMLNRLNVVSDERIKALSKIARDKLRVARAYNNRVRFEILFGRQFCLSGLKATSSGSAHQIGKDRIESRK
jgi:hypothetical protein